MRRVHQAIPLLLAALVAVPVLVAQAPPAQAQASGCTPCECGVAYCDERGTWWPRLASADATRLLDGSVQATWQATLTLYDGNRTPIANRTDKPLLWDLSAEVDQGGRVVATRLADRAPSNGTVRLDAPGRAVVRFAHGGSPLASFDEATFPPAAMASPAAPLQATCAPCACAAAFCAAGETWWLRLAAANATRSPTGQLEVSWTAELWTWDGDAAYGRKWQGGDGAWTAAADLRAWVAGNGSFALHRTIHELPVPGSFVRRYDASTEALDVTIWLGRDQAASFHVPAAYGPAPRPSSEGASGPAVPALALAVLAAGAISLRRRR